MKLGISSVFCSAVDVLEIFAEAQRLGTEDPLTLQADGHASLIVHGEEDLRGFWRPQKRGAKRIGNVRTLRMMHVESLDLPPRTRGLSTDERRRLKRRAA